MPHLSCYYGIVGTIISLGANEI